MPLPYRIEICDGPRVDVTRDRAPPDWPKGVPWKRPAEREYVTNPVAVKVYPDGQRVEATAEEAAVWEHVQVLERQRVKDFELIGGLTKERGEAAAKVADLTAQLEAERAKQKKRPGAAG